MADIGLDASRRERARVELEQPVVRAWFDVAAVVFGRFFRLVGDERERCLVALAVLVDDFVVVVLDVPRADRADAISESTNTTSRSPMAASNDGCWLGEYQADVNGAINIVDRYRSGESHRRSDRSSRQKAGDDDSATDGASLTGPQDSHTDAETQQVTLGTYVS